MLGFLASFLGALIAIAACLITKITALANNAFKRCSGGFLTCQESSAPFLLEQQSEPADRIEFFSIKLPR